MSFKGKVVRLLAGNFLPEAKVVEARDIGGFRWLRLRSNAPKARAGTKVQLLLPSDEMRTYTPIATDDGFVLVADREAGGPGSRWMTKAHVGTLVRFVGPQESLRLPEGPVILVGDETSVAVAAAFEAERPGKVHAVLQARKVDEVEAAVRELGLSGAVVRPAGDIDGLVEAVMHARAASPTATIAVTGGSQLVVAVRSALRARGMRDVRVKTYWIPGRTGLD
ncbi:MAG: hypothetical protein DIU72_010125 [Pseudomonadota bacterium]